MASFRVTPKPGTLGYHVSVQLNKAEDDWKPPRRYFYFTADVDAPAKLYLANDVIFDLIGRGEIVPVWVTVWEDVGQNEKSDKADGSASFIHVDTDPPNGSPYNVTISADLEPARFEDVLKALQAGLEVRFDFGTRSGYMFGSEKPKILGYHQPSWRHEGDCLMWRNDLKTALAIDYITIITRLVVPEPPKEAEDVCEEPKPDPAEEATTRWNEVTGFMHAVLQSIKGLEITTVAAHHAMMARVLWAIAILGIAAALAWFHH